MRDRALLRFIVLFRFRKKRDFLRVYESNLYAGFARVECWVEPTRYLCTYIVRCSALVAVLENATYIYRRNYTYVFQPCKIRYVFYWHSSADDERTLISSPCVHRRVYEEKYCSNRIALDVLAFITRAYVCDSPCACASVCVSECVSEVWKRERRQRIAWKTEKLVGVTNSLQAQCCAIRFV